MNRRSNGSRAQAFILLAMLIAIGVAMAVTSAALWTVRAEHAGRVATTDGLHRRAAAWSAAQAIAALVGEQRRTVLAGGEPTMQSQVILYEDGPMVALARIIPGAEDGRLLVAEASLLDAQAVDAEAMALAGIDAGTIDLVLAARSRAGGRISALEEITERGNASPALLRGEQAFAADVLALLRGARGGEEGRALAGAGSALRNAGSALDRAGERLREGGAEVSMVPAPSVGVGAALYDRFSVLVVEPSITREGSPRIEIDGPWVDLIRDMVGRDLDADGLKRLEALAQGNFQISSDEKLVECLATLGIPPERWGAVLDRVTAEPGMWRWGRVDINRANASVLATLPGMSAELAVRWERERESLDPSERVDPAWPVLRGLIEPAAFAALHPRITTRSFFWRVRYAVGFADAEQPDGPLTGVTIWECVVDLSAESPRLAALRDLSLAPVLERLLAERRAGAETAEAREAEPDETAVASAEADRDSPRERAPTSPDDRPLPPTEEPPSSARADPRSPRDASPAPAPARDATARPSPTPSEAESDPAPPAQRLGAPAPGGRYRPRAAARVEAPAPVAQGPAQGGAA